MLGKRQLGFVYQNSSPVNSSALGRRSGAHGEGDPVERSGETFQKASARSCPQNLQETSLMEHVDELMLKRGCGDQEKDVSFDNGGKSLGAQLGSPLLCVCSLPTTGQE